MTQDEREQKAPPCDCTRQDKDGNWYQECYCQNNGDLANAQAWCTEQNIHHAAMTEGGVWVSREDAEAAPLIARLHSRRLHGQGALLVNSRPHTGLEGNREDIDMRIPSPTCSWVVC
jgi:hypothetical protein